MAYRILQITGVEISFWTLLLIIPASFIRKLIQNPRRGTPRKSCKYRLGIIRVKTEYCDIEVSDREIDVRKIIFLK